MFTRTLHPSASASALSPRCRGFLFAVLLGGMSTGMPFSDAIGTVRAVEDEEPKLSLRASPRVGFAPVEILFVAELRGGADDYEDLYCVTIEWDWDDDTRSESTPDCDPYEPGTSTIRRRYSVRHRFDYSGRYEIRVNLKKRGDIVASARTNVELRGGRFD